MAGAMTKPLSLALCLSLLASACADPSVDEDPVDEPALTADELAALPAGADDPEHALDHLLEGPAVDDGAAFDDDLPQAFVDVEVVDDGAPRFAALLASGLHPRASDALRASGVAAWRITQTIGNAPASAGYHAADGTVNGRAYCAATDLSVRGLTATQIHNLLERLARAGFAAWYRKDGVDGWRGADHLHVVYANAAMKSQLRAQVRSFLVGRNGLVSNTLYRWHDFSDAAVRVVKAKFAASAGGTSNGGAGVPARINTAGAPLTVRAGASASTAAVGAVADGTYVVIRCQRRGQTVSGTYGASSLWDKLDGGYVADAYVATGSDGQVAPTCP
jgi:uncharacterized protein YraI